MPNVITVNKPMSYVLKKAKSVDQQKISNLIKASVWALSANDYTKEQIAAALTSAWGLDTQLVEDQTYYCIWADDELAGCGGWSFRKTLFGSSERKDRDSSLLDPSVDAAKIRAFFIHPLHSRKGLGSMLLKFCEKEAWDAGFTRMELGATLPGSRLYLEHDYIAGDTYQFQASAEQSLTIIPMFKCLTERPQ